MKKTTNLVALGKIEVWKYLKKYGKRLDIMLSKNPKHIWNPQNSDVERI